MALFGAFPQPPPAARDALRTRADNARKHGMRLIAEAIVANGIAEDVRTHQPAAMAFVRESIMTQSPEGYAKNCEALASATAADLNQILCPVLLVTGDSDKTAPVIQHGRIRVVLSPALAGHHLARQRTRRITGLPSGKLTPRSKVTPQIAVMAGSFR